MNFDSDISLVRYLLRLTGLWPLERTPCANIKFIISLVLNIIGVILNVIQAFNSKSDIVVVENSWYLLTFSTAATMMCFMKKCETSTMTILNWMGENYKNYNYLSSKCQIAMSVQSKKAKKMTISFHGGAVLCVVCTIFGPIILAYVKKTPIVKIIDKGWYSFGVKTSPGFEIIFAIRALAMFNCATVLSGIETYMIFILIHMCGQINILGIIINTYKEDLNHFVTIKHGKESNCNDCLRCFINRHNSIAKISTVTEECLSYIMVIKLFFNGFEISILGFLLITNEIGTITKIVMNIVFFIMLSWSCIIFGWLSDQLTEHGHKIANIIYSSNWYDLNPVTRRRTLSAIICRAQIPMKITAGKFFTISLKTIGQLFVTWLSYISVLNAVKSSQK